MCVKVKAFKSRLLSSAAIVTAVTTVSCAAQAQTVADTNILNLLSPFLTLPSTAVGQQTLQLNLSQALAINNGATLAQEQLAISDKNLLSNASNTVTGLAGTYGVAYNLAGGLPAQAPINGITPIQAVGGYGVQLGAIYDTGVNASTATTGPLQHTVSLLTTAYNSLTSPSLGVAKFYFANGTTNGTTVAVAPAGTTLPTSNGLPNMTNSVYDLAYGVNNTQSGQNIYGDSRPDQVRPALVNQFDPTALSGLTTNPSFPSGHTTYAYTDSILLGMLVPQEYQSMLSRASEYANSRIVLGVHYPLDIIASRALASYDLSQAFTNASYINNAATTGTAVNLPSLFTQAQPELQTYLATQCGNTVAACASSSANTTGDPYVQSAANQATYQSNLTYGLPTLSFAQAPREQAPSGGTDASILLAPIYGGSTAAAQQIAPTGGLSGNLSTGTINQIIVNTETNALAAFYGTSLSYWTRIDLYTASIYFQNVTGTLVMAPTDNLTSDVAIGNTGQLFANGTITGATTVNAGGALSGTGVVGSVAVNAGGALAPGGVSSLGTLNINGNLTFAPGSAFNVRITPTTSDAVQVAGTAALSGNVNVTAGSGFYRASQQYTILTAAGGLGNSTFASASTNLAFLRPVLSYDADDAFMTMQAVPFNSVALNANQANVGAGLTRGARIAPTADGMVLIANLQQLTVDQGRAALDQLSGQGITGAQNAAFEAGSAFAGTLSDQMTFWHSGDQADTNGITLGGGLPSGVSGYAPTSTLKTPIVVHDPVPQPRTWRMWGNGFGGGTSISGNFASGTTSETGRFYGGALGVDYQMTPNWLIGIAAGGSDANFNVSSLATSGRVSGFHLGLYDALDFGNGFYGQSISSFGDYTNHTKRYVAPIAALAGTTETGSFGSIEWRERIEVGRLMHFGTSSLTPFVAMEIASLRSNGFSEVNTTGAAGSPALQVNGGQSASAPVFAGGRLSGSYAVGNGMIFTPLFEAAYLHEFAPQRNLTASFISLPGSAFLVSGARPARDAVQTKVGGQLAVASNVALFANFDGEFSGISQTYSGRGGVKVFW